MIDFLSDNASGAAPEVIAALAAAAHGPASPYGEDPWTARAEALLEELFERPVGVFPVISGTAANSLALASVTPPYGGVLCHEHSHVLVDECGAPEFFSGGARLMPLPGAHGRLCAVTLRDALAACDPSNVHAVQPYALTLTQATEAGTVYRPDDLRALCDVAHANGLAVHMDGARFANAVAYLGCAPADLTWKAGVDLLSFGFTKNGAAGAEAVIVFDPARASDIAVRRKRAGHLLSKMRFVSAQIVAMLDSGLWLRFARQANAQAQLLAHGLEAIGGVRVLHAVEANEVFAVVSRQAAARLAGAGLRLSPWTGNPVPGMSKEEMCFRLVASFATTDEDVRKFLAAMQDYLLQVR